MNIDLIIVALYMVVTVWAGFYYGRGVKTIGDFALGGRNFGTAALSSTIIATWVSGSWFVTAIEKSYVDGGVYFFSNLANCVCLFMVGLVLAPRMKEFFGSLSIAESMGNLYGTEVKIITALVGILLSTGLVAMQMKILAALFQHFSNIPSDLSLIITASVVIVYCIFGGIRAVTFTDVIQFICLMFSMCFIFVIIYDKTGFFNNQLYIERAQAHLFTMSPSPTIDYFSYTVFCLIPVLNPANFQRILIGKNVYQLSSSFSIASIALAIFLLISSCIGILVYAYNPDVQHGHVFGYVLDEFSFPGIRGIVIVGVLAMAMSTIDSHLNSAAVIFSHDICGEMFKNINDRAKLIFSRSFVFVVGACAILLSTKFKDSLSINIFTSNFYVPVVTVPMLMTIMGFRSTKFSVLSSMFAGFSVVYFWKYKLSILLDYNIVDHGLVTTMMKYDSMVPGIIANLTFLLGSHFLFNQKGGWVGPKDLSAVEMVNEITKKKIENLKKNFRELFDLIFLNKSVKIEDQSDSMYCILGVVSLLSYITISISSDQLFDYGWSLAVVVFLNSALLIVSPIWIRHVSQNILQRFLILSLAQLLYTNSFLLFAHGFSSASVVSALVNIFVVAFFFDVFKSVAMLLITILVAYFYHLYNYGAILLSDDHDTKIVISYSLFACSVVLMFFFKNQRNKMEQLQRRSSYFEEFNQMLEQKLQIREQNLQKSLNINNEILNNISHEIKTPMNIVINNVELLESALDIHDYENVKSLVSNLKKSVNDFHYYASNMLDLSEYRSGRMIFDIRKIDFENLVQRVIEKYDANLWDHGLGKYRVVKVNYNSECSKFIECDEMKIFQMLRHLIDNAIKYSIDSLVRIDVSESDMPLLYGGNKWRAVMVSIKDRGVGIPEEELKSIFNPFTLSSRTKDGSGGKGIGLALSHEIVKYHYGKIWAENNTDGKGCTIKVLLPINYPYSEFLGRPVSGGDLISNKTEINRSAKNLFE